MTGQRNRDGMAAKGAKAGKGPQEKAEWFVLRDLQRANAASPARRALGRMGFDVFVPAGGGKEGGSAPAVRDLLFVRSTREALDPVVERTPTLQYLYAKGAYRLPMTVREKDMERFIREAGRRADSSPCTRRKKPMG